MTPSSPEVETPLQSESSPRPAVSLPDLHLSRARSSLKQAVNRYTQQLRTKGGQRSPISVELQAAAKVDCDRLNAVLQKLDQRLIRIAIFGLVSRGKSAVINALMGQKLLQTGPLHGVTQYPRSVYWTSGDQAPIELIDTPGLDEVGGESRASMAKTVAEQADLILFVVAGDITRTEYQALAELQTACKPIILVFNKTDLYPHQDRQTIYRKLETLFAADRLSIDRPRLAPEDIVLVAAEPAAMEVRVEWEDGRVTHEWEAPPPQIEPLRQKLLEILQREGKSLLALNALRQAREADLNLARKTLKLHRQEAETLIWQFAKWKAIAVAANPIAVLDLLGGAATDLVMIRNLAKLYGLPMTNHEAGKLLRAILWSSGSLLLGEVGSSLLFGAGKSAAAVASTFDSVSGVMAYGSAAAAQASLAGYGSYRIGKATQVYLEQGCTWGPQGVDTVIQDILQQVDAATIIHRLRQELQVDR
ncbi:MAG: GTP-binding protein [Elainella sp. Prado103]|nr:GTP-binding protein [Elainella sp. Prado103]